MGGLVRCGSFAAEGSLGEGPGGLRGAGAGSGGVDGGGFAAGGVAGDAAEGGARVLGGVGGWRGV